MTNSSKLPQGRLARLSQLAAVGARTGVSLLGSGDGSAAAAHAAKVLGQLRGIAAKVGQMASYVDGVVPEERREAYEAALGALRSRAPTSAFGEIRALVESELGAPLRELYVDFDEVPFASASIGQVHRATLADGTEVAVKVQHPGIAEAVESDLATASVLEPIAALAAGRKVDTQQVLEELRARFREELDYRLEAERQALFAAMHAGDPTIRIPAVIAERSGNRVLTTELVSGVSLEEAAHGSPAERRAYAETLWRFVFKGNLVGGHFNADPHPGNFLFRPGGVVSCLDFGCVEPLPEDRVRSARLLHAAAVRRDEAAFRTHAASILGTRPGVWEDQAIAYSRRCFEPLFASPYRITRAYAAELVSSLREMTQGIRKLPKGEHVTMPKGMLFMNRLQFGFYSVLARLDVEVDYAAVERAFYEEAGLSIEASTDSPR